MKVLSTMVTRASIPVASILVAMYSLVQLKEVLMEKEWRGPLAAARPVQGSPWFCRSVEAVVRGLLLERALVERAAA